MSFEFVPSALDAHAFLLTTRLWFPALISPSSVEDGDKNYHHRLESTFVCLLLPLHTAAAFTHELFSLEQIQGG